MKIKTLLSSIALSTLAAAVCTPSAVLADNIDFTYTDTADGISASGVLTISGSLVSDVDGSGFDGYAITGISGERNGVSISGLVSDPNAPAAYVASIGVGVQFDNDLLILPYGLDNNGLAYLTADANEYNVFSVSSPSGGGYYEAANGTFTYDPIDLTLTAEVPEEASTMGLLGFGLAGLAGIKQRRFLLHTFVS